MVRQRPNYWRGFTRGLVIAWLIGVILFAAGVCAGKAWACDPGQYYDPTHQICQGSPPAYPPPGYGRPPTNNPNLPRGN